MNHDLEQKSDAELDAIFTTEVAGWTREPFNKSFWKTHDGKNVHISLVPKFTTDANAALPWLEKHPYVSIDRVAGDGWQVAIMSHTELASGGYEEGVTAEAWCDTLARASVIALIKAKRAEKS